MQLNARFVLTVVEQSKDESFCQSIFTFHRLWVLDLLILSVLFLASAFEAACLLPPARNGVANHICLCWGNGSDGNEAVCPEIHLFWLFLRSTIRFQRHKNSFSCRRMLTWAIESQEVRGCQTLESFAPLKHIHTVHMWASSLIFQ